MLFFSYKVQPVQHKEHLLFFLISLLNLTMCLILYIWFMPMFRYIYIHVCVYIIQKRSLRHFQLQKEENLLRSLETPKEKTSCIAMVRVFSLGIFRLEVRLYFHLTCFTFIICTFPKTSPSHYLDTF